MATTDFNSLDKLIAKWRLGKIIKLIDEGDTVFDFGCGSQGYFLNRMAVKIKSGVGLDFGTEDKTVGNLMFINCKFKDKLPSTLGKFDKVVMLAVLEHLEPKTAELLFGEFSRILKSKGRIILTTPTLISKPFLEFMAFLGLISRKEIKDHKKYYDQKSITDLAGKTGYRVNSYRLFQLGLNSVAVLEKI